MRRANITFGAVHAVHKPTGEVPPLQAGDRVLLDGAALLRQARDDDDPASLLEEVSLGKHERALVLQLLTKHKETRICGGLICCPKAATAA